MIRNSVSSPRHLARSVRVSRTTRSCRLLAKGYETYRARAAFGVRRLLPAPTPPLPADALMLQAARPFSLLLDVYPPSQVLQLNGRLFHLTPASRFDVEITCSRAPLLHGRYPASSLLRAQPPPSRLRPTSRCLRLYGLPCSTDFSVGRGRLPQLLGMSWSPCCPYHPAGVMRRISQIATHHAAFAPDQRARPPEVIF